MTDFPTVGLKVDLSQLGAGDKAYDKLKSSIEGAADAADRLATKVQGSAQKVKSSNDGAAASERDRSRAAEKAAKDEERAAQRATKEAERQRKYLQQVRLNSIRMEETARQVAEAQQARAAAKQIQEAQRVAREVERTERAAAGAAEKARRDEVRAAEKAARDQEAIERGILNFRIRMRGQEGREAMKGDSDIMSLRQRMWAQQIREAREASAAQARAAALAAKEQVAADKKAAAEAERNRKYLLSVRLKSIQMEEAAQRAADAEAQRRARDLARISRGGGGGIGSGGGGGGSSGGFGGGAGDVTLINRMQEALARLRGSLAATRRLFFDLRTAVGVFLGAMIIRPVLDMADAMTALKARAGAFASSASDVPYIMEAIFAAAQRSRAPLDAIATLYTRLAPLAKQLGKSQLELLRVSETVAKGLQIGGATPEETKSASQQLAQALASNRLGGDELRSLSENAPILMSKIAQALNMNTGQFIKWAQAGKANAAVVVGALESAQADIDRLFQNFPVTIGQSITLVRNSFANYIGKVNEATDASAKLASVISGFSAFLDSSKTVNATVTAVNALAKVFGLLGAAMGIVIAATPAIATMLAVIAAARVLAIVRTWMALRGAIMAYYAAIGLAVPATGALAVAQNALGAAGAAAGRSMAALAATLGGPLGIAVIAVAGGFAYFKANALSAQEATNKFDDATQGAAAAVDRAIAFLNIYGASTKDMTDFLLKLNGVQDDQVVGLDEAGRAAVARAKNEQALTASLLDRAAAESVAAAASLRRSVVLDRIEAGYRKFTADIAYPGSETQKARQAKADAATARGNFKESLANRLDEQALRLPQLAEKVRNTKIVPTVPDRSGAPETPSAAAAAGNNKRNPFEGALDGIKKMEAAIAGLKQEIKTISANPLDVLVAQIKRAGDEAAASLEAGSRENPALAKKTRDLAMEKERLTILKQMIETSAGNTRQIQIEADANDTLAAAQQRSSDVMKEFWGSGSQTLEGYNAALSRSRQITADAEVAASDLSIAQRYGVRSLADISGALQQATMIGSDYADQLQAQAVEEAAAAAAAIRRKAVMDAIASKDSDLQAFNSQSYEDAQSALEHMVTLTDNLGDSLSSAFGRGGQALGRLLQVMNTYSAKQLQANKRVAEAQALYGKSSPRALEEQRRASEEMSQAQIEGYAEMAAAAKGFFKEGSAGYKALQAAEMAFRVFEFAMTAKSIAVKAAETAAKIGFFGAQAQAAAMAGAANMFATLGPAGFAAVAAMIAVLGGLGLALSGGGGGGVRQNAETRQKAQGAGSVLGDAQAKSDSIARALEIVASNTNDSLEFSNDMLTALRSIDSNISALTTSLARQLGVGGFLSNSAEGLGTKRNGPSDLSTLLIGGPVGLALSKLPIIGGLINSLFGTTKKTTLQDAGISFGSGSLADILNQGINGQTYQDIATQTKKKFFGVTYSNKTKVSTTTADLDAGIADEITRVIESLRTGVLSAAGALGVEGAAAVLDAMTVDLGKISFKDMTGEEIQQALQAIFSKLGDDMAVLALPMVEEFQKAGEGAFETLIRIARDYQVLDISLKQMGMTFGAVGTSSIKARERLIELSGGIDELASQTAYFAENFLTDQERIAPVITAVYTELGKLGFGSIKTKEEFKKLVQGLDLTTESGAQTFATLMKVAPGFAQIVEYMDGLTAANDNVTQAQGNLNDAYEAAARLIKDTHDRFAGFVETFKAFRQQLETGPLAENSPQDQYLKTKQLFETTRAAALSGDEKALADLQSVSQAYLEASRDYYASTEPYFQDLAAVKAAVDQAQLYAQAQVDKADQQLAALNQMVAGYITLNNSVLTVAQAVNNVQLAIVDLKSAMAEQAAAVKAAQEAAKNAANGNQTPTDAGASLDVARYLAANPDLGANWAAGGILTQLGSTLEEAARAHYLRTGQTEIASGTRNLYDTTAPATPTPAPAAVAAAPTANSDLSKLTDAVNSLTTEMKVGNVLAKSGYTGTLEKLDAVVEGLDDVKAQTRANAA